MNAYFRFPVMWNRRTSLRTSVHSTINPQYILEVEYESRHCAAKPLCSEEFENRHPCFGPYNKIYCVCIMYQTVPILLSWREYPVYTYICVYFPFPRLVRQNPPHFLCPLECSMGTPTVPIVVAFPFAGKAAAYFAAAEVTLTRDSISCPPAAVPR